MKAGRIQSGGGCRGGERRVGVGSVSGWAGFVWVFLVLAVGCGGPRGSMKLFEGGRGTGWRTWLVDSGPADPRGVFRVEAGRVRISGDGLGYVGTTGVYSNYVLSLEFRWGRTNTVWGDRLGRARDSGVFLHAVGPDGNSHDGRGAFRSAIECNLFEGACGDFLLIRGNDGRGGVISPAVTVEAEPARDREGWPWWKAGGERVRLERWGRVNRDGKDRGWRDEFGFRGRGEMEREAGKWNRLECECRGQRIRVWLNGRLVNEATDVWPSAGAILLQCEGSEVEFRRVRLVPLGLGPVRRGGSVR